MQIAIDDAVPDDDAVATVRGVIEVVAVVGVVHLRHDGRRQGFAAAEEQAQGERQSDGNKVGDELPPAPFE